MDGVNKTAVPHPMVTGKRLFINVSSTFTACMGSKKQWLLLVEDSTDYTLSFSLEEKSELKDMMMSSLIDLKTNMTLIQGTHAVTILEKMRLLNSCTRREG